MTGLERRQAALVGLGPATPPTVDELPVGWPGDDPIWLWTSRYQNTRIAESGLVPVRTSLGYPKFRLAYRLAEHLPELTPDRWMFPLAGDVFEAAYRAKLDAIGLDVIVGTLRAIRDRHDGRGLVLLCFEDLSQPGPGCHRRSFANWFREQTGEAVPELDWRDRGP